MTTTTTAATRIVRFTATHDQDCASPWPCDGVTAGQRCGYVSGLNGLSGGPRPVCGPCCDRIDTGELPDAEPADTPTTTRTHTVDIVEPAGEGAPVVPEVGDIGTIAKIENDGGDPPPPAREPLTLTPEPCPDCAAPILWTTSSKGRRMPIDAIPHNDGNVIVQPDGAATVLSKTKAADAFTAGSVALHRHHRLTCAKTERWAAKPARQVATDATTPAGQPATAAPPVEPVSDGQSPADGTAAASGEPPQQPAPNTETVEQLRAHVDAIDTLADAGLITTHQQAAHTPPTDRAQLATPTDDEPMPPPDLTGWMPEATQWGTDPKTAAADLVDAIRRGILAGDHRSRQIELGPSEIGHECPRWLAYRLAGVPPTGTEPVPWRQRIGTLVHDDIDDHAHRDNAEREAAGQPPRWLTGIRVNVGDLYPGRPIVGTLDVLDLLTATVLDAKVPGATAMRTYGPGKPEKPSYRTQVQLYGRGVMRAGFLPAHVGVLRVSPARELAQFVVKTEPFDARIAEDALARAGAIARMVDQLGARAAELTPPTEAHCSRCPWFRPGSADLSTGCPGAPGAALGIRRASVDDLVA